MKYIYNRYGAKEIKDCQSLEEGISMLDAIEDDGGGYALGVWDETSGTIHVPNNYPIGYTRQEALEEKLGTLRRVGIVPLHIEHYRCALGDEDEVL